MSDVTNPSRCPIDLAASAIDAVDLGIFITEEIASMVSAIHDRADRSLDGLSPAQVKKRMTSLNRLILVAVQFADGRGDMLRELHRDLHDALAALAIDMSECWTPVGAGTMPPCDLPVIAWDSTHGEPCTVFLDPGIGWILQCDPTTIHEGAITHWRHCNAPGGIGSEGDAS